jgi:hypothetical protein
MSSRPFGGLRGMNVKIPDPDGNAIAFAEPSDAA